MAVVLSVLAGFLLALAILGPGKQREMQALRDRERAEADRAVARLGRQLQEQEARARELADVYQILPDLVRQMFAATARRGTLPVVIKLIDHLFHPTQCAIFVPGPEGRLRLGEGKGLPPSLSRGMEIEAGHGRIGLVATKRMAMDENDFANATALDRRQMEVTAVRDLLADIVAPIEGDDERLLGVICAGGLRVRHGDEKRLLKMVADLAGLAMVQVERLRRVQNTADVDGLTGTYNKRYLDTRLGDEIHRAEREQHSLGLLMLDIDHFKNYNDSNGHLAGDEVLKVVGHLLKDSVREDDVVARYGGEEFVLLYPGASKAMAYRLAQALRRSVETHGFPHAATQPLGAVTISGGVACFPEDGQNAVELLRAADEALYAAKEAGRNRIIGASPNYLT